MGWIHTHSGVLILRVIPSFSGGARPAGDGAPQRSALVI